MKSLKSRILEYMADPDAGDFPSLAFEVFQYQWERNAAYRTLLERRGMAAGAAASGSPATTGAPVAAGAPVATGAPVVPGPSAAPVALEDLPAVSTVAFKTLRFTCGEPTVVFRTSGTTRGADRRGEHHLVDTDLYRESLLRSFRRFVLAGAREGDLDFLVVAPSASWAPDSSLGFMMDAVTRACGGPGSRFLLGPAGLDRAMAFEALRNAEGTGRPVLLLGTAFALVHLLDAMEEAGIQARLPAGSRLMDTGGFKGRSRELSRGELLDRYGSRLGIPGANVVNEYGMTELGSQFYDASLLGGDPEVKLAPHWVRTLVIDPVTGRPAAAGQPGLLRHVDLANLDSVAVVETEDLGVARGEGFILLGRATGAELRGCSLATEELLGEALS